MKKSSRRSFLKQTGVAATAVSLSARSWAQIRGANSDIRVAVVGFNSRGQSHIEAFGKMKGVRITGLCDVDRNVLERETARLRHAGQEVETHADIRMLLESKNIDALSIATPNHWHALGAIWAIKAGKDVYLEKPVSHNVWEGRKIVEAARKYRKIVQTGTQARSSTAIQEAVAWVRAGNLGAIQIARGLCYKPRPSIGKSSAAQEIPEHINYDLWCGPAPLVPPRRNNPKFGPVHYDWHWLWDYGNGDLGNQGVHQMDLARWFLGEAGFPERVISVGGRLGYEDDGETPNTQIVYLDYAQAPLIFEVRGLPEKRGATQMDKFMDTQIGVIVECENGHVKVTSSYGEATAFDKAGKEIKKFKGNRDHFENFIQAVRSRKTSDLNADIEEGHVSAALCHLGNISHRVGHPAAPETIGQEMAKLRDGENTFERMRNHLAANDVDLIQTRATLGALLEVDGRKEGFVKNKEASELLRRDYRKPFVVPSRI